ncbi:hypothetical protein Slin15195_G071350 [Septoria linicola]|uniref:Uncharacterized protein n=1 Tax=Septoria linicola TaxID=215465 RepID=A0A9Q9B026_9PEZI|nr:hypothetical protein Slin14017_G104100 [Septoria linicola]USW53816.1 hypothetical protein Slin15195_G071350 [Septoria linicola]
MDNGVLDADLTGTGRPRQCEKDDEGLEDTRLGHIRTTGDASTVGSEKLVKVQAMIEMFVKASDVGLPDEIEPLDI